MPFSPFFMMVLMAKGFIIATPFIVRAISGNIMMPALSGGLGGGYSFARAAMGSQQAYNRYLIGGASGAGIRSPRAVAAGLWRAADAREARHGADWFCRRHRIRRLGVKNAGAAGEIGTAWATVTGLMAATGEKLLFCCTCANVRFITLCDP